jgi:LAO/AO transport system kinase
MKLPKPEEIFNGNRRAAAKLMRAVDDRNPESYAILRKLYPYTGKARIIGLTGFPGSGKSTIADKLIDLYRKEGKKVGVIAVDPSSPFSGGAILGDRLRMVSRNLDDEVFIRSVASRGYLGGLSASTRDLLVIFEAMGCEIILLETVGVGQAEIDVAKAAHTCVVILVPGMGDEIQALKAGILEIGDIFVINKADREGAEKLESELLEMIAFSRDEESGWRRPAIRAVATEGKGIVELSELIDRHGKIIQNENSGEKRRLAQKEYFLKDLLQREFEGEFRGFFAGKLAENKDFLDNLNPYSVISEFFMEMKLKKR